MKNQEIKPEDKFMICKHCNNDYCEVIKHQILNGFASKCHCKGCKEFEEK